MRGDMSSASFDKRHPLDWYVDPQWCAEQLIQHMAGFFHEQANGYAIWDPCCGMGNTLQHFAAKGLQCFGSDVVDNFDRASFAEAGSKVPEWFSADFLELTEAPARCSIVFNPPYSYRKGIAEAFVRHALKLSSNLVCALLPGKWLAPGVDKKVWSNRSRLFREDHPPARILHFSTRPSMPPGDVIHLMGNRAFRGGVIDYCWIVWDVQNPTAPGDTRTFWLPPLGGQA